MKPYTVSALALLFALGVATSAADAQAQVAGEKSPEAKAAEEIAGDTDADRGITSEEARARGERRFEEITGGEQHMTPEQFGTEMTGAEDVAGTVAEIDRNGDGQIDREEWLEWQTQRFTEATRGTEGRMGAEEYETWSRGARMTPAVPEGAEAGEAAAPPEMTGEAGATVCPPGQQCPPEEMTSQEGEATKEEPTGQQQPTAGAATEGGAGTGEAAPLRGQQSQ